MSNKNKKVASGGGSRSLLMTFMFLTAVAACGVSGYLFWEMKFAKPAAEVAQGSLRRWRPFYFYYSLNVHLKIREGSVLPSGQYGGHCSPYHHPDNQVIKFHS